MWLSLLFIFTKLTHVFSYVTNLEKGLPFGLLKRSVTFMETSFLKELYIHGSRCCHKKPCLYMNASFFFLHQPTVVVTIEICEEAVGYYYLISISSYFYGKQRHSMGFTFVSLLLPSVLSLVCPAPIF